MTAAADLTLEGIVKRYGAVEAVRGVSLAIGRGSYVVLLGPSGSGKTTLLSILGGFTAPTAGRIVLGDRDITATSAAERPTATPQDQRNQAAHPS
jgi:ABC-type Fe3+/spermidine/putrescine transport system ATPase subunit